jgi:2-C-methyl-D-erythritol 2,4-cyclodiphosphate synthase
LQVTDYKFQVAGSIYLLAAYNLKPVTCNLQPETYVSMNTKIRVGIGYDLHRLVEERRLFLGGVEIPFEKGLSGHSDADVLLHAISDALLGACGRGDIGMYFPDKDPRFKDISSRDIIKKVYSIAQKGKRVKIINIDAVIICDKPDISVHRQAIRDSIAGLLNTDSENINIKAKTTERTSAGTISSFATVLIEV